MLYHSFLQMCTYEYVRVTNRVEILPELKVQEFTLFVFPFLNWKRPTTYVYYPVYSLIVIWWFCHCGYPSFCTILLHIYIFASLTPISTHLYICFPSLPYSSQFHSSIWSQYLLNCILLLLDSLLLIQNVRTYAYTIQSLLFLLCF